MKNWLKEGNSGTGPVMMFTAYFEDDEGDYEEEMELPARYEVCWHCHGTGRSSAYLGAFTGSDMDEMGPEFMEDYFNGAYDKDCPECGGLRVVLTLDTERAEHPEYAQALKAYQKRIADDAHDAAIYRAEMRLMGDY